MRPDNDNLDIDRLLREAERSEVRTTVAMALAWLVLIAWAVVRL